MKVSTRIALIGDYNPEVIAHQAIPKALLMAAPSANCTCEVSWVGTEKLESDPRDRLGGFHGIWCVPSTPYRSMNGALEAIRFAREASLPFLGTCGGFQHAAIEYARNVLGLAEVDHAESNPRSNSPLIAPLACPMVEQEGAINLLRDSFTFSLWGMERVVETYHCRYGINQRWENLLFDRGLKIAGTDQDGGVRIIEIPNRPFFIATLFQPERSALRGETHPLIQAFIQAACQLARRESLDSLYC